MIGRNGVLLNRMSDSLTDVEACWGRRMQLRKMTLCGVLWSADMNGRACAEYLSQAGV